MRALQIAALFILVSARLTYADDEQTFDADNLSVKAQAAADALISGAAVDDIESEVELGELGQRLAWELDKSIVSARVDSAIYRFVAIGGSAPVISLRLMPYDKELVVRGEDAEGAPLDTGIKLPLGQPGSVKTVYSIRGGYSLSIMMPKAVKRNFLMLGCLSASKLKDFKGVEIAGAEGDVSANILGKSPVGFGVSKMHGYLRTTKNAPRAIKNSDFDLGKMASLKLRYEADPDSKPEVSADRTQVGVSAEFVTKNPAGYVRRETSRDVIHAYPVRAAPDSAKSGNKEPRSCFLFMRQSVHSNEYLKESPIGEQP